MTSGRYKIGVVGASEIALRRFLPALAKNERFEYFGVAHRKSGDPQRALSIQDRFGGRIIDGYPGLIEDPEVDAIYVSVPPGLHFEFGREVLISGKHLFLEKPFTTHAADSEMLVGLARELNLAAAENYMFRFHRQIATFRRLIDEGIVGTVDRYEVKFCFPLRERNDFRYDAALGGGALLDCGGYAIMLSNILVGGSGSIGCGELVYDVGFDVDMHGSGTMISSDGNLKCAFYYGMNDDYCCSMKAFGTKGILHAPRAITAPPDLHVVFDVEDNAGVKVDEISVGCDDMFYNSISNFCNAIEDGNVRELNFRSILEQASLVEAMRRCEGAV